MIIRFIVKEENPNGDIFWFEVKLPNLRWTSISVGLNANGAHVSASATFYELDKPIQNEAIALAKERLAKVMK